MRKILALTSLVALIAGCAKHDPILPGVRTPIFDTPNATVLGITIENLPVTAVEMSQNDCPYRQNSSNTIWDGERKIFTGFPTTNSVHANTSPVCAGKYVIAGLTTGELVRVNPKNRQISWIADIYSQTNMTGGASVLDIVAPIIVDGTSVYAGGMGDAFCRVNINTGTKKWCTPISVTRPFIVTEPASFVIGADNALYAVRNTDGAIYWRTDDVRGDIKYSNGIITVGRKKIDAATGKFIK